MWRRSCMRITQSTLQSKLSLVFCRRMNSGQPRKRFAALWGNGDFGRLGLGSLESQWRPAVCSAFDRHSLVAIACGGAHTLFLTGSLWFWYLFMFLVFLGCLWLLGWIWCYLLGCWKNEGMEGFYFSNSVYYKLFRINLVDFIEILDRSAFFLRSCDQFGWIYDNSCYSMMSYH